MSGHTTASFTNHRGVRIWLWTGIFMVLVQVAIGGITRLTDSGLSMTNWEPVKGSLPPLTEQSWLEAFEDYKQYPEFYKKNADFSLAEFKRIFWWEYIHRAWARMIGLVFLFPFIWFWRKGHLTSVMRRNLFGVMFLGMCQAVMGWVMVSSGLVDSPWVSPYRLTAHLFLALGIFCWLYWLILKMGNPVPSLADTSRIRPLLKALTVLALVQIAYGGLVAGSDAARFYNTWPAMGNELIPSGLFANGLEWSIFRENKITSNFIINVQFIHRTLAILVLLTTIGVWMRSRPMDAVARRGANLLLMAIGLQFLLGVATIVSASATHIPVNLGVLHQLGAFLLTGVLVYLHVLTKPSAVRG